jgi:Family of unknown function (DUF6932)
MAGVMCVRVSHMTLDEFKKRYGKNPHREKLLLSLEDFSASLRARFSCYRTLAYGSFITEKNEPNDIDIIICIASSPKDSGFNLRRKAQEFADDNLDIFTLSLKTSFDEEIKVPTAVEMQMKFNSLPNHVEKGINCDSFIELEL